MENTCAERQNWAEVHVAPWLSGTSHQDRCLHDPGGQMCWDCVTVLPTDSNLKLPGFKF